MTETIDLLTATVSPCRILNAPGVKLQLAPVAELTQFLNPRSRSPEATVSCAIALRFPKTPPEPVTVTSYPDASVVVLTVSVVDEPLPQFSVLVPYTAVTPGGSIGAVRLTGAPHPLNHV